MTTSATRRVLTAHAMVVGLAASAAAQAAEHYVATDGTADGDGTQASPWDLDTALRHPNEVQSGDTIWIGGGVYAGIFESYLTGTAGAPIMVRAAAGQRATIDGGDSGGDTILHVLGAHTWFWNLEVMSSDPVRVSAESGSSPADIGRGWGPHTWDSEGIKLINLVVHDAGVGIAASESAVDTEIYGCLIYNNGWDGPDRGHGHAIYPHNETGTKVLRDNVMFDQYGWGIHAYGPDDAFLQSFMIEGNVSFNNGRPAQIEARYRPNILAGGDDGATGNSLLRDITLRENLTYSSDGTALAGDNNVGYVAGCASDITIENNTFAQERPLRLIACDQAAITGNTLIGDVTDFDSSTYPDNDYHPTKPSGLEVFVRPNAYEPGRAHVVIYNWDLAPVVSVDLAPAGLELDSPYQLRDAQNFWGEPVASGTYDGTPVDVPMAGLDKETGPGMPVLPHSAPEFGVFMLFGSSGGPGGGGGTGGGTGLGGQGAQAGSGGALTTGPGADGGDDGGCGCYLRGAAGRDHELWPWLIPLAWWTRRRFARRGRG
ncbi:MAG: right-handed parallel beta-helix repeat-containing protein [Deltaproteobacteria bacterium]|nr:right-handed parallel beta-helix repeat-containing protein [Deltaproteobacteria bacterium]